MKLSYSSSNFTAFKLIHSLFTGNSRKKTIEYFKAYTEKNHILLTSSCRSALFLTYSAIKKKGKIITSPLTCAVAIEPIIETGNRPVFADINPDNLVINCAHVSSLLDKETIAIQAIHFGGVLCDMASLKQITRKQGILLVEDCAQGFLAPNLMNIGRDSDIACFSLSKNLYGIGGGILATNDPDIYNEALRLQNEFPRQRKLVVFFRILRSLMETYDNFFLSNFLLKIMLRVKAFIRNSASKNVSDTTETMALTKELVKPDNLLFRISSIQQDDFIRLHEIREKIGVSIDTQLSKLNLQLIPQARGVSRSYVKYYLTSSCDCRKLIPMLNKQGIEAKHLEAKHKKIYQTRFDNYTRYNQENSIADCPNYLKIHDYVISLPCREDFSAKKTEFMLDSLKKAINTLSNGHPDSL
jgi:dTDP-4-amino-4,6-dideoxygalactose transaminase